MSSTEPNKKTSKYCKYCDTEKKESDFYKNRRKCKKCQISYIKDWNINNKDKRRVVAKRWLVNNHEKNNKWCNEYYHKVIKPRRELEKKNKLYKEKIDNLV